MTESAAVEAVSEAVSETATESEAVSEGSPEILEALEGGTGESQAEEVPTYTVKVDGVDTEVTLDEVLKGYQLAQASYKKMEEASKARKDSEKIRQDLQTLVGSLRGGKFEDRVQTLAELVGGPQAFADLYHEIRAQEESYRGMSESERQAHDYKQQLARYQAQEKQREAQEKQTRLSQETARWSQEFPKMFSEALTAEGVRVTPYKIQRMASLAHHYLDKGQQINAGALARAIKKESGVSAQLGSELSGEDLLAELGEDVVKRIEKAFVSKYKKSNPKPKVVKTTKRTPKAKMKAKDWFSLPLDER